MTMMAAGVLAATSCTDFDDYNKVSNEGNVASAGNTLWENIQQNPQLTTFAELVKKSGFDQELNQTHYYTVWAPVDGSYDASAYQGMNSAALLKQFVKNHVAEYGHSATGQVDERVLMLSEKTYDFAGNGNAYTFDGINLDQNNFNIANSNGVLHLMDGQAVYYPNIYEFITDTVKAEGYGLDSLSRYFRHYENVYLDEDMSIAGSIVDGMQTYVDSVMVTQNDLWTRLNAKIQNEDSTYTFLLPTNEAWRKGYERIKGYYNYIPTIKSQKYVTAITENERTIDPAYWQDSMVTRYLTRYLAYSNTDQYNQWIEGEPSYLGTDTIRTTLRGKLSNPAEILSHTIDKVTMSNGVGRVIDSLAIIPWETYAPELDESATYNTLRVLTGNAQAMRVEFPDPEKVDLSKENNTRYDYLWVEPTGGYSKPELDILLPNVLSTTYEIYCIFVPENVDLEKSNAVTLPNRVIFELNYCDETGTLKNVTFLDESEENINSFQEKFNLADNATNRTTIRAFSNDTSKVDTVYVGEFTFPACYYGLNTDAEQYCPNIKITSPFSAFSAPLMAAYTRDLRIAGILLKPKELVEFEESNKE